MNRTNPHHAAPVFNTQPFSYVDGIVIAIPGINPGLSQFSVHEMRVQILQAERKSGHPLFKFRRVCDAVQLQAWNRFKRRQKNPAQFELICPQSCQTLLQFQAVASVTFFRQAPNLLSPKLFSKLFKIFN